MKSFNWSSAWDARYMEKTDPMQDDLQREQIVERYLMQYDLVEVNNESK